MRHPSRDRLNWNENCLSYDGKNGYSIVEDPFYPNMWRVVWPDGVVSEDFYNRTWAKFHCERLAMGNSTEDTI